MITPAAESTLQRLDETRQRWWLYSMLCSVILAIGVSIATLLLFVLADVLLQLSSISLLALLLVWLLVSLAVMGGTIYRLMKYQRNLAATARRVELSFPDLGSDLINLVHLTRSGNGVPENFRAAAIAEASVRVANIPFHEAAERHSRWWRWRLGLQTPRDLVEFSAVLLLLLAVAYVGSLAVPKWSSSAQRLFTPWEFVPQTGTVKILEVVPGDAEVLAGSRLEVFARIETPGQRKPKATIYVTADGDEEASQVMFPNEQYDEFRYHFPAVLAPLSYRLQIGDSQSEMYRITVRQKPTVQHVDVSYEYPQYLDRPPQQVRQNHADLEAPQFTTAHLTFQCSSPLSRGHLQVGERKVGGRIGEDRRTLAVDLLMTEQATYTVHLVDELGHTDAEPRVNGIRVLVDEPPGIQLVKPAREMSASPGRDVALVVRGGDDNGLGEVRLEWKVSQESGGEEEQSGEVAVLQSWNELGGVTATTLAHVWSLNSPAMHAGQTLLVRGVAVDRRRFRGSGIRLEPQESSTSWRRIRLIDAEVESAEKLARLDSIGAQLWEILQTQLRARLASAQLLRAEDVLATKGPIQDVRQRQIQVQTRSEALARSIDPERGEREAALKRTLDKLAHDEMLRAARQADALVRVTHTGQLSEQVPPLMETQDQIIEVLRKLLELNRRTTSETLAEMQERPGGDLPDDVAADKLRELSSKLDEFLKQQKRVIEATKNLAKRPVDDFTEEEEQLLKELAAVEDEWARFMEEVHSDFSKLPEQDYSNPSLLEELVEVQTELKMAEGALTKKTADIAVPLEQLGAEMAEELVTNIEKWLPDTPDRERWSQEEPLTDEMKEAPMAELPGELEDLVGELMEEEEDLFDEMEDVSSSWADSLDKGAGWDAADGPISNMSAKGVTGNRLPNTSEIGGRSGEGRQGKASGEFVGDTAVGKGGRKTPSRLAPDPQVKGQVKDFSKDPVGGATGGGKESGIGGEGLEGPVPSRPDREMQRLAEKQAELRNRAESVDLKFQILNYHHTDLEKLIEMMAAVETDLRSGRYQSALRRREVLLDGLGHIKTYLDGEFHVRQDRSSNLPQEIQKELLGSMQDASPSGWEELNRKYFERLAEEDPDREPAPAPASPPPGAAPVAAP